MSEFYKKIEKDAKYCGYLNWKEKAVFYTARFFTIILIIGFISSLLNNSAQTDSQIVLVVMGVVTHLFSIGSLKRHSDAKIDAVGKYLEDFQLPVNVLKEIITEIENSKKDIRTFATWITGLFVTYVALLSTLIGNFLSRALDIVILIFTEHFALMEEYDYSNVIDSLVDEIINNTDLFSSTTQFFFVVLTIFVVATLLIYLIFSAVSFTKNNVLMFLYDLRYELLVSKYCCDLSGENEVENHGTEL